MLPRAGVAGGVAPRGRHHHDRFAAGRRCDAMDEGGRHGGAFNKPVASHLLPEIHVHLVAAVPNGLVVEYMPWTWRLFDNPPMPVNGEMTVPTGPGLGLNFAPDLFDKYGIS